MDSGAVSEGPEVGYTVKELLTSLGTKLDAKADRSEMERLLARLERAEHDMVMLTTVDGQRQLNAQARQSATRHWSAVLLPVSVSSVITITIAAVGYLSRKP